MRPVRLARMLDELLAAKTIRLDDLVARRAAGESVEALTEYVPA